MDTIIPDMTDPLGKQWTQPHRCHMALTDTHVTMRKEIFNMLLEYSSTLPSGAYPGKMWKRQEGDVWLFGWYGEVPDRPDFCSINYRTILLTEVIELLTMTSGST